MNLVNYIVLANHYSKLAENTFNNRIKEDIKSTFFIGKKAYTVTINKNSIKGINKKYFTNSIKILKHNMIEVDNIIISENKKKYTIIVYVSYGGIDFNSEYLSNFSIQSNAGGYFELSRTNQT